MTYEHLLFTYEGGVGRLTLNRPERLNSFNDAMHGEIRQVLTFLEGRADLRGLVVTGAGRGFCAGQDLSDRAPLPDGQTRDLGAGLARNYNPLVQRLRALPAPVVCIVNGVAAGAGVSLALACDVVVACESASFVFAFSKIGLMPDAGGTFFLPRLVGTARAMGLALLGERLSARQAAEWGLIWKWIGDDELAREIDGMTAFLAAAPTRALGKLKHALYASDRHSLEAQLDLERDEQRELGTSQDYREGVEAFLAKRAPRFTGR